MNVTTASTTKMMTSHFAILILIPATPLAPRTAATNARDEEENRQSDQVPTEL